MSTNKIKILKSIAYKNIDVSFSENGVGQAIVLLHGFLENKNMWNELIPHLSKRNRVIAIDLLGHGNTGCIGYVHTMEDQAEMVHFLLTKLRIRKAVIIGHSMGGYVALAFAELFPDFMKGIVLLNSTSKADSEEKKTNRDRAIAAVKTDYTSFVRLSINNLFSEINRLKMKDEVEATKTEALKTPLQGIVAALEGMKMRAGRETTLRNQNYPKLLILGREDGVLPYEEHAAQVDNTSVMLFPLSDGHMSHIERKDELLEMLLRFLSKV